METNPHHVLIGVFTLAVVALLLLFGLWLGHIGLSRQHHYYDVVFTHGVTGLSEGSPVKYNGIRMGEVSSLKLDPDDPGRELVRIEVAADAPIKTDTRAELHLHGLTGASFVELVGGTPASKPLLPTPSDPIPIIPSQQSTLHALLSSGKHVMASLNHVLARLDQVVSPRNIKHLNRTLANIDQTTTTLAAERGSLRALVKHTTAATGKLDQLLGGPGSKALQHAAAMTASLQHATQSLNQLLSANQASLQSSLHSMGQIGPMLRELKATSRNLHQMTNRLKANPAGYLLGRERATQFTPKQ
jgi:phospholipid/cholesterol/gamma-HCH transport system substrate-binding protein